MRLAFFSKQLPSDQPNGVSVQVDRLAEALVTRGHTVTCFSLSPKPAHARYDHVQFSAKQHSRLYTKFAPALLFRSVDTHKFDILHYHGDDYLCSGGKRRVRTFYGSALFEALHAARPGRFLYQSLFYLLEIASCLKSGALAGISRATRSALPFVSTIIPCGVPLDKFSPAPDLKSGNPSLLFIGDFKSRKQGDLLLRAFASSVLPVFPSALLTVVGPETVAAPNVRCLGRIDESALINEYRKAWVYCMPSSYEGFGVPAIEANACGTVVAALDNRGTREVIDHNRTGRLCTRKNFGETLTTLLSDEGLRTQLIAAGMEQAQRYDMRMVAERYQTLYEKSLQ